MDEKGATFEGAPFLRNVESGAGGGAIGGGREGVTRTGSRTVGKHQHFVSGLGSDGGAGLIAGTVS